MPLMQCLTPGEESDAVLLLPFLLFPLPLQAMAQIYHAHKAPMHSSLRSAEEHRHFYAPGKSLTIEERLGQSKPSVPALVHKSALWHNDDHPLPICTVGFVSLFVAALVGELLLPLASLITVFKQTLPHIQTLLHIGSTVCGSLRTSFLYCVELYCVKLPA